MVKIGWMDTETTGLDHSKHAICQLALVIEIDGAIAGERTWEVCPVKGRLCDKKALEVNGLTFEQIRSFPPAKKVVKDIEKWLEKFVDRYDKTDKLIPAGYNVDFDITGTKNLFLDVENPYFGSYFNYRGIDVLGLVYVLRALGLIELPDYKLGTVCAHFGVPLGDAAHDATADIKATRDLFGVLTKTFILKG